MYLFHCCGHQIVKRMNPISLTVSMTQACRLAMSACKWISNSCVGEKDALSDLQKSEGALDLHAVAQHAGVHVLTLQDHGWKACGGLLQTCMYIHINVRMSKVV